MGKERLISIQLEVKDEKQVYADDTITNLSTEVEEKKVYFQNETGDMQAWTPARSHKKKFFPFSLVLLLMFMPCWSSKRLLG